MTESVINLSKLNIELIIYVFVPFYSEISPDHSVDDIGVALYELDDLCRDVGVCIVRDGYSVVPPAVHLHGGVHGLQQ